MPAPYMQDKIENWVSDFVMSDAARPFPVGLREMAADILVRFLGAACAAREVDPGELEDPDFKVGLLHLAALNIPEGVRADVPALCAALLTQLEAEGRLSDGRVHGAYVKALGGAYLEAASGKSKPITRAGSKIGRNDPCPCGSGKKYKKCCG